MASKGSRRLFDRLGRIAVVAGGVLVTAIVRLGRLSPARTPQPRMRVLPASRAKIVARMVRIMAGLVKCRDHPLRNPYFGELHVHTAWSLDPFVLAALNGPDEAFRYAKGEPARLSTGTARRGFLVRTAGRQCP